MNSCFYNQFVKNRRYFMFILGISFLFFLPFIIHHPMYNDDYVRSYWGVSYFIQDGRILSDLILFIFSGFAGNTVDISPLTWIISWIILSISAFIWLINIFEKITFIKCIYPITAFIAPPFIQINFFRYDNLTISVSFAAAFLASINYKKNVFSNFYITAGLLLVLVFTYQLSMIAFFIFCCCVSFVDFFDSDQKNNTRIINFLFCKAFSCIIVIFVYKFTISFIDLSDYAKNSSDFSFPNYHDLVVRIIHKIKELKNLFTPLAVKIVLLMAAFFILSFFMTLLAGGVNFKEKWSKFLVVVFLLLIPSVFFINVIPLSLVTNRNLLEARYFLGIGAALTFMLCGIDIFVKRKNKILKRFFECLSFIPVVYATTAAFAITNAFEAQQRYTDSILISMIDAINAKGADNFSSMVFYGIDIRSLQLIRVSDKFTLINSIVYSGFAADPFNIGYKFQNKLIISSLSDDDKLEMCKNGPILKGIMFDMYTNNKKAIFDFSKRICEL